MRINKAACKKTLIRRCYEKNNGKDRVAKEVYDHLDRVLDKEIDRLASIQPRKGKTITV